MQKTSPQHQNQQRQQTRWRIHGKILNLSMLLHKSKNAYDDQSFWKII